MGEKGREGWGRQSTGVKAQGHNRKQEENVRGQRVRRNVRGGKAKDTQHIGSKCREYKRATKECGGKAHTSHKARRQGDKAEAQRVGLYDVGEGGEGTKRGGRWCRWVGQSTGGGMVGNVKKAGEG